MKHLVLIVSAATLMTGTAFAADPYQSAPVYSPSPVYTAPTSAFDWSGFYVGANVGAGWGEGNFNSTIATLEADPRDANGYTAGVQAGANAQFGNFVLGVEGDVAWANIGSDEDLVDEPSFSVDWMSTIRGRAGFAADAFLIYGTAGVAFAGVSADALAVEGPGDDRSASATHTGWTAGAGVEAALTDNISLKGEYLYADFGSQDYDFGGSTADASFTTHSVKAGLNFHF